MEEKYNLLLGRNSKYFEIVIWFFKEIKREKYMCEECCTVDFCFKGYGMGGF